MHGDDEPIEKLARIVADLAKVVDRHSDEIKEIKARQQAVSDMLEERDQH